MSRSIKVVSTIAAIVAASCVVTTRQPAYAGGPQRGTGDPSVAVASNGPAAAPAFQPDDDGGGGGGRGQAIQVGNGLWVRLGPLPEGVTAMPALCGRARTETCNNAYDDDCDGQIDEGCAVEHGEGTSRHTTTVQSGPMQFAVAWNSTTDVNMYVTTHDQGELGVVEGRTTDGGGEYQLEVHGACDYDASVERPMENVRWTRRPPLGTYTIKVQSDYMCDAPRARTTFSISVGGRVVGAYQFVLSERSQSYSFRVTVDDQP